MHLTGLSFQRNLLVPLSILAEANLPRWRGLQPRRPALGVRFLDGNLGPKIAEVQPVLGISLEIRHVPIGREMTSPSYVWEYRAS